MESNNLSETVVKIALEQFSETINHREKIFIQFALGILIAIAGYSIVYVETETHAHIWELTRAGLYQSIISYPISALVGSYILAQSVLILLARFILSSGFSYRKYQAVVFNIRKKVLGEDANAYFGNMSKFSPYDKKGCFSSNSYLPEFETIFFVFIWGLQIVLFVSIIIKLSIFEDPAFRVFITPKKLLTFNNTTIEVIPFWLMLCAIVPIIFTCYFQFKYYDKYLDKIFNPHPKLLINRNSNPEYVKLEKLRRYKRKNSLTWGYLLLFFLFNIIFNTLLFIGIRSNTIYLEPWEVIVQIIVCSILYSCIWYNLKQSYVKLADYRGEKLSRSLILKKIMRDFKIQMKSGFLHRSTWAKSNDLFSYWFLFLFIVLTATSIVLISFYEGFTFPFFVHVIFCVFIPILTILKLKK